MSSPATALIALGCMLAGILLGLLLRRILPDHHTRDDSKDVMKTAAGMMATLVALIIGLLVSSAKSSFDSTTSALTQGGAKVITLDRLLIRYGSDAAEIRVLLRNAVASGVDRIWPDESSRGADLAAVEAATGMEDVYDAVRALSPGDESHRYLKSQALQLSADLMHSRWMLIEQSQNSLPTAFLIVLIFWLTALFTGLAVLAPRNLTAASTLSICALSMAGAVFLILELNRPLEGTIKASSAPLRKALTLMEKS